MLHDNVTGRDAYILSYQLLPKKGTTKSAKNMYTTKKKIILVIRPRRAMHYQTKRTFRESAQKKAFEHEHIEDYVLKVSDVVMLSQFFLLSKL